jgi:hypothetical protein
MPLDNAKGLPIDECAVCGEMYIGPGLSEDDWARLEEILVPAPRGDR